jgi:hypothetical protein
VSSRERFDRWLLLAESQLDAARRVDPAALQAATDARRALQEELARTPLAALDEGTRAHAAGVARRIRAIDLRVHACGATVINVLERVLPDAAPRTYGRRGQMRGI